MFTAILIGYILYDFTLKFIQHLELLYLDSKLFTVLYCTKIAVALLTAKTSLPRMLWLSTDVTSGGAVGGQNGIDSGC